MSETEKLIKSITDGIQEKKGKGIIIADLNEIDGSIGEYFVICQGNSPAQVNALTESVYEQVLKHTGDKPTSINRLRNAQWVSMDYSNVLVHIFLPEIRAFYDLEHLWADAKLTRIPDLN